MDPIAINMVRTAAKELAKCMFDTNSPRARLIDNPVRLGNLIKWRWRRRDVAASGITKLVHRLLQNLTDHDPVLKGGISETDGSALESALVKTLLAFDSITMDVAQEASLDENRLADLLMLETDVAALGLTVQTEPIYLDLLKACCLHIIEHFSAMPEFASRSVVAISSRLGSISENVSTILDHLFQEDGLYVWVDDDFDAGMAATASAIVPPIDPGSPVDAALLRLGGLPNLQDEFARLVERFDEWVEQSPRKEGERLRAFWIEGSSGIRRSKSRLACLARGSRNCRQILDAGQDLQLASRILQRAIFTPPLEVPPIVSVDLTADTDRALWNNVRNVMLKARTRYPASALVASGADIYPRLVISGSKKQRREAHDTLLSLIELTSFGTGGLEAERPYSFHGLSGLESKSLKGEDVYNRGLPITTRSLVGRRRELDKLNAAWENSRTRIISVVASGGTGKSALVNTWLKEMRKADYRGAHKVLAWSFYSQGTKENLVSADPFVNFALDWLGAGSSITESAVAKGAKLASLMQESNFLLVLDGMEPLQHPLSATDIGGQITDDSMKALLEELAKSDLPGLTIITTRVPLTDLYEVARTFNLGPDVIVEIELENLSDSEAVTLIRRLIERESSSSATERGN